MKALKRDAFSQASSIAAAVEAKLYIRGKGYFGTLQPNGTVLPVRTCLDFMYVTDAISEQLSPTTKKEMEAFFARELQRDHWMVALSADDPIASNPNTRRDDVSHRNISLRKTPGPSTFPMFVPSLSW